LAEGHLVSELGPCFLKLGTVTCFCFIILSK